MGAESARHHFGSYLSWQSGTLAVDLWIPENKRLLGSIAPVFYTQAGEIRRHPERFDDAIRKITGALACLGCKHTHVAVPPPITVT